MRFCRLRSGLGVLALAVVGTAGCSSSAGVGSGSGGAAGQASGGSGMTGTASGGTTGTASGGAGGTLGGSGGVSASGGMNAAGGATGVGGATSTGGATSAGGATGAGGGVGEGGTLGGGGGAGGFGLGGPSRCAGADVAFCESFESGLDTAIWSATRNGDSTLAVDTVRAARGTKALHFKTTAGDFAYIKEMKSFPATNNILYGRMFVWFEDDITTSGHFSLAEGGGTGDGSVIRFGGQNQVFGVGTDGGASGDWTDKDDKAKLVPSKTWICAEFQFKADTNEFRVWWDDQPRPALSTGASKHSGFVMPTFKTLWFGWWMYNMKEPQELWIDEIAVDFKPIGCAK